MKGKELTAQQVKELPHGTRIVIEHYKGDSDWNNDNALINQDKKIIGNYHNCGDIDNCIWGFKDLEFGRVIKDYDIHFYEYIDEKNNRKKTPTTLEEGYKFQIGDIVTGLKEDQWLRNYKCEIMAIHDDETVGLKYIENIKRRLDKYLIGTIDYSVWCLDELKLVSKEEPYIAPKEEITEITETTDTFTKSMLKTGHLVQTKNGRWWFVFRDLSNECFTDGLVYISARNSTDYNSREFMNLDRYTEDLKRNHSFNFSDDYDIVKVAVSKYSTSFFAKKDVDLLTDFEVIWEREKKQKISVRKMEYSNIQ